MNKTSRLSPQTFPLQSKVLFQHTTTSLSNPTCPCPRTSALSFFTNNKLFVHSGRAGNERWNDLWTFDVETKEWTLFLKEMINASKLTLFVTPPARSGAASCSAYNRFLFIYGGNAGPRYLNDGLWVFDTISKQWRNLESMSGLKPRPKARTGHSLVHLPFGVGPCSRYPYGSGSLFLVGGWDSMQICTTTWEFSLETQEWILLEIPNFRPTSSLSCVSLPALSSIALFGGWNSGKPAGPWNDIQLINVFTKKVKRIKWPESQFKPVPMRGHQAVLVSDYEMFVFGGLNANRNFLASAYLLDFRTNEWRKAIHTSPFIPEIRTHTLCSTYSYNPWYQNQTNASTRLDWFSQKQDPAKVFLFGGETLNGRTNQVIEFSIMPHSLVDDPTFSIDLRQLVTPGWPGDALHSIAHMSSNAAKLSLDCDDSSDDESFAQFNQQESHQKSHQQSQKSQKSQKQKKHKQSLLNIAALHPDIIQARASRLFPHIYNPTDPIIHTSGGIPMHSCYDLLSYNSKKLVLIWFYDFIYSDNFPHLSELSHEKNLLTADEELLALLDASSSTIDARNTLALDQNSSSNGESNEDSHESNDSNDSTDSDDSDDSSSTPFMNVKPISQQILHSSSIKPPLIWTIRAITCLYIHAIWFKLFRLAALSGNALVHRLRDATLKQCFQPGDVADALELLQLESVKPVLDQCLPLFYYLSYGKDIPSRCALAIPVSKLGPIHRLNDFPLELYEWAIVTDHDTQQVDTPDNRTSNQDVFSPPPSTLSYDYQSILPCLTFQSKNQDNLSKPSPFGNSHEHFLFYPQFDSKTIQKNFSKMLGIHKPLENIQNSPNTMDPSTSVVVGTVHSKQFNHSEFEWLLGPIPHNLPKSLEEDLQEPLDLDPYYHLLLENYIKRVPSNSLNFASSSQSTSIPVAQPISSSSEILSKPQQSGSGTESNRAENTAGKDPSFQSFQSVQSVQSFKSVDSNHFQQLTRSDNPSLINIQTTSNAHPLRVQYSSQAPIHHSVDGLSSDEDDFGASQPESYISPDHNPNVTPAFRVLKSIVAARSPFLYGVLCSEMQEDSSGKLVLRNMTPSAGYHLLHWIYTGSVNKNIFSLSSSLLLGQEALFYFPSTIRHSSFGLFGSGHYLAQFVSHSLYFNLGPSCPLNHLIALFAMSLQLKSVYSPVSRFSQFILLQLCQVVLDQQHDQHQAKIREKQSLYLKHSNTAIKSKSLLQTNSPQNHSLKKKNKNKNPNNNSNIGEPIPPILYQILAAHYPLLPTDFHQKLDPHFRQNLLAYRHEFLYRIR